MPKYTEPIRKTVIGTDPAANTEIFQTVPAGKWWILKHLAFVCLQGATQTPQPILSIDKGLNTENSKGTFTVTIASPGVVTNTAHGLNEGDAVFMRTTGALPTGLAVDTVYYVITAGLTADAFQVSATRGGSAINTSGTQSGTHTLYAVPVVYEGFGASAAQAVSTTCRYNFGVGLSLSAMVGTTTNVHATAPLPNGLLVGPGYRIYTNTLGKGANTNHGAPLIWVEEYTDYPSHLF